METVRAISVPYNILLFNEGEYEIYPYLRDAEGDRQMFCLSPHHGRSFLVAQKENGRSVISKGNGLSYSQYQFLNTREFGDNTFGLLLHKDAERDFLLGKEIEALGIKTNHMECVIELEKEIQLATGHIIKPVLLQYDVECPYRICDAAFMTQDQIKAEILKWERMNDRGYDHATQSHLIAANVLIRNLRILHDNGVLHNAIHEQNYTWALELLDFELASSPAHPYAAEDTQRHVQDLFPREMLYTYVIIKYIAEVLHEEIDYATIDNLFAEYGFNLQDYNIRQVLG